jgi:hypothetical protein
MVAALKAPLPDANQLSAFAAVLGDADDSSDAAAGISACGPLDAPPLAAEDRQPATTAQAEEQDPDQGVDESDEPEATPLVSPAALQAAGAPPAQLQEGSRPAL